MHQQQKNENGFLSILPHILQLPQVEPCTHLGIIAGTVVCSLRNIQPVAKIIQRITPESINLAGRMQRAFPLQRWQMQPVQCSRVLQATPVKWHIVCYQHVEFIKVSPFYFLPNLTEIGRILRIFGPDTVYLYVAIVITVVLRTHQPRAGFCHFSVSHYADAYLTDRSAAGGSCFEVYCNEIYVFYWGHTNNQRIKKVTKSIKNHSQQR